MQQPTPFRHSEVTAPNWELVPFEVGCARCGHDLRGLTEPKCPSCALAFEWSQAVPIEQLVCRKCSYHLYGLTETRCPECGEPFTWAEVLAEYHRKRKPLFEYHWRDRPFRSLVYTWWLALRPWKLWRIVDIHDPPRAVPLFVMLAVMAIAFLLGAVVPSDVVQALDYLQSSRRMASRGIGGPGLLPVLLWSTRFTLEGPFLHELARAFGAWSVFTFAALLVFQQSMRRCRVRGIHVLRILVFTLCAVVPIATLACFVPVAVLAAFSIYSPVRTIAAVSWAMAVGYGAWAIQFGYRHYLQMPHSAGVVLASQAIALLASTILCTTLNQYPWASIFIEILEWVHLW